MNWVEGIGNAVAYMEEHLAESMTMEEIARQACVSSFHFQKAFSILCGFTPAEYIRARRLSLAGSELIATEKRIIDIALAWGYDSPDSFTKAFTRFHGVTPTVVRRERAMLKSFAPLKIHFSLKGGSTMDYKIVEKEAFTVMGVAKRASYESSATEIPGFWEEEIRSGKRKNLCGMFGVCIADESKTEFDYLIADNYLPWNEVPEGFVTRTIPKFTWAVFACRGPMPEALQAVNREIFSEWLPNHPVYEFAANYNIEMYAPARDYPRGTQDENYYSEIWIPVKKKA